MEDTVTFLTTLIERGGPVMWPIALCSVITVFTFLQKTIQWSFYMLLAKSNASAWTRALQAFSNGEADAFKSVASPYAAVVRKAQANKDLAFQPALEAVAHGEVHRLARGLGVLDTIVTLAPMLGILGTVTGIITAFNLMGASGTDDPAGIASGIAEALITTAAGLVVSMVALLPLNVGRVWHRRLALDLQNALTAVEHHASR